MSSPTPKEQNAAFFQAHLNEWLGNPAYKHKFVVIHDSKIKGVYDRFDAALEYAAANFSPNEFVIQQVIAEDEQINFLRAAI